MFREKLKKDLDGISPDEELLIKVTKMMQEEAQKPRPNIYRKAVYFGGMAAAVCMIAIGGIAFMRSGGIGVANETAAADFAADSALGITVEEKAQAAQADEEEAYAPSAAADSYAAEDEAVYEADMALPEDGYIETEAPGAFDAAEDVLPAAGNTEAYEEADDRIITLPEYENKGVYETTAANPLVRGPAASYEEIVNGRLDEIDSFYRIRITGTVDSSEAVNFRGYNIDTDEFASFYTAVIEHDYLAQTEENEEIILRVPGNGGFGMNDGCPPYSKGDVIAVVLQKNSENEDFRRRFSYVFDYDIYEIDGVSYAAVRSQNLSEAEEGLTDYFGGEVVKYETTTPANPAVYYGLYEVEGIAENLRRLFAADRASLSNVLTVYKGENIDLTEQEAQEIISTAEKYMAKNKFQLLDLMLSPDQIEEIGENGLRFKAEYDDGSYTAVYIDGENSYVCEKYNTYSLGGEDKEYILSFFE